MVISDSLVNCKIMNCSVLSIMLNNIISINKLCVDSVYVRKHQQIRKSYTENNLLYNVRFIMIACKTCSKCSCNTFVYVLLHFNIIIHCFKYVFNYKFKNDIPFLTWMLTKILPTLEENIII